MEILPGDSTAKTLYFRAIRKGSVEDVKVLVRLGADVNWKEEDTSFTGLIIALAGTKKDVLEFLPSKGADVNLTDEAEGGRRTPLMWVCLTGKPDLVERLCQVPGILLNARHHILGHTALMCAAAENNVQCIEKLRAVAGVDWNVVTGLGYSALMLAIQRGHFGAVEALLPVSSLDLNWYSRAGLSAALIAVQSDHVDALKILQLLCQDGRVNWNITDEKGDSPVVVALYLNKVEMFRTLVKTPGVNTNITDGEGRSLVQLIMEHDNPQFRRLLWSLDLVNIDGRFSNCPVCDVKYPRQSQVFQCARGHFICGDCRPKLYPDHCPVCRGIIIGRARDLEKFLKGLQLDSE